MRIKPATLSAMKTFQIYKSSAGSGKTTALIHIFLRLSLNTENAAAFRKILAITFTNKAAGEMKERLIGELESMSNLSAGYDGKNFKVNKLLEELNITAETLGKRARAMFHAVLHDYHNLSIGTIDQFNHRLIRSFSRELNLKSDFEVELNENELFAEAAARLLEKAGNDPFITQHLVSYTRRLLSDEKYVNLQKDLQELQSLVTSDEGVEAIGALKRMDREAFDHAAKLLRKQRKESGEAIRAAAGNLLDKIRNLGIDVQDLKGRSNSAGAKLQKLLTFPDTEADFEKGALCNALQGEWITKNAPAGIKAAVEPASQTLTNALLNFQKLYETEAARFFRADDLLKDIHLIAVLEELGKCLDELCAERNILPISRFNKIISEALRREPVAFLYEHYGTRFDHILIDEFQDTSELQWYNILPLIDESMARGKASLVVGDAKQSIYRWRGGKAELLISLPELYTPPPDIDLSIAQSLMLGAKIQKLNSNYRSKPAIVTFNNALFARIGKMTGSRDSLYGQEYSRENLRQEWKNNPQNPGLVHIDYLGYKPEPETVYTKTLEYINEALDGGYSFGDMAILMRGRKEIREITEVLQEAGIPMRTAESFEVDKDVKVQLITAFLRLSLDPDHEPAKLTVMRCMQEIRDIPYRPGNFLRSKPGRSKSEIDLNAFLRANSLPAYLFSKKYQGVLDRTESIIQTYLDGQRSFYINGFLNLILARAGTHGSTYEFFEWWDGPGSNKNIPETTESDAVQLMTLHKAKGLQFKIVILPQAGWKKRKVNNERKWFNLEKFPDTPLPWAPFTLNSKLANKGLNTEWMQDEAANDFDNLNLLYVGFTRPVDALYVAFSGAGADNKGKAKGENTTAYWLWKSTENLTFEAGEMPADYRQTTHPGGTYTVSAGRLPLADPPKETLNDGNINWISGSGENWVDRVRMAPIRKTTEQTRGIWFHKIVAKAASGTEMEKALSHLEKNGELNPGEIREMKQLLDKLYSDTYFVDLLKNGKVLAERELYHRGSILRPDLVVESEEQLTVIDFKTGAEEKKHEKQISGYAAALKSVSPKRIEALLLYTEPYRWKKVDAPENNQARLF